MGAGGCEALCRRPGRGFGAGSGTSPHPVSYDCRIGSHDHVDGRRRCATCRTRSTHWRHASAEPVLVEDARHQPLWWSAQGEVDGDPDAHASCSARPPPAAAALVSRLGLAHAEAPVRTPAVPEADMLPSAGACRCAPAATCSATCGCSTPTAGSTEADLPRPSACADLAGVAPWPGPGRPRRARDRRRAALLTRLARRLPIPSAARELIDLEDLRPTPTVAVTRTTPGARVGRRCPAGCSVHVARTRTGERRSPAGRRCRWLDLHIAVARARSHARALRAGARPGRADMGRTRGRGT